MKKNKITSAINESREAGKVVAKFASVLTDNKSEQRFFVSSAYLGPTFLSKKFKPGSDKIYYTIAVYGDEGKKR